MMSLWNHLSREDSKPRRTISALTHQEASKNAYVFLMVLLSIFGSEMAPKWHQKVIRKVH